MFGVLDWPDRLVPPCRLAGLAAPPPLGQVPFHAGQIAAGRARRGGRRPHHRWEREEGRLDPPSEVACSDKAVPVRARRERNGSCSWVLKRVVNRSLFMNSYSLLVL